MTLKNLAAGPDIPARNTRLGGLLMPKFRTIKALVLDHVHRKKGVVDYDDLTKKVLTSFPGSAWKRTHWAWYRYQILRGRFRDQFTDEERETSFLVSLGTRLQGPPERIRSFISRLTGGSIRVCSKTKFA